MRPPQPRHHRRATVLVLIIGLLTMLFMMLASFLTLARSERQAVVQIQQGARTEGIVDNLTDVLASIGITDEQGRSYTRIPGFGDAAWLASSSPYRDPNYNSYATADPNDYRYAAASSLNGAPASDVSIRGASFSPSGMLDDEWRRANARRPFMDADADGIADADFRGSALATQIANSIGGRSINADIVPDPNNGDALNGERIREFWRLFSENARYEVAVRIISHGGMVQIASPSATERWNTRFLMGMFDYLRDPRDNAAALDADDVDDLTLLNSLYTQRAEAEAFLRYRGGILNPRITWGSSSGSAAVDQLARRIAGYGEPSYTLFPAYDGRDAVQRFNLADTSANQWEIWRRAVMRDPDDTFVQGSNDTAVRENYAERRDLTTVNNSDELIRKQGSYIDPMEQQRPTLRLMPGSSKFYLGNVVRAFDATTGAFLAATQIGDLLTGAFGEMISSYTEWRNTVNVISSTDQPLLRSEQARMLAANTLAFAAPRTGNPDPNTVGIWVDVPWVVDRFQGGYRVYFGVAPQPYLTQAMIYKAGDSVDPNLMVNAAAIEFFNPHDVSLDPNQFGISIVDPNSAATETIRSLGPNFTHAANGGETLAFNPRRFSLLLADDGANDWFRNAARVYGDPNSVQTGDTVPMLDTDVPTGGEELAVRLWRLAQTRPPELNGSPYVPGVNHPGVWVLIDELKVGQPDDRPTDWGSDPNDPNTNGPWPGAWTNSWRDTDSEASYWSPGIYGTPRWRIVVPDENLDEGSGEPDATRLAKLKDAGPSYSGTIPTAPLYTMNPALGSTLTPRIHGVARPAAFPTVGFMHFIGRFAHTYSVVSPPDTAGPWQTAGHWLARAWKYEKPLTMLPRADIAFMPVFSNRQPVSQASEFSEDPNANGLGRVPWGLLVYDYFTTINPGDGDGNGVAEPNNPADRFDRMRVDGRININFAPWHVLAALPLIGPNLTNGTLPINQTVPPTFWSPATNMLLGDGPTTKRLLAQEPNSPIVRPSGSNPWYRLGNWLGQAVASYRDGVRYTKSGSGAFESFYGTAAARNLNSSGTGPDYRSVIYADPSGVTTRGGIRDPNFPGFVTLGELLNVKGFDSTMPTAANYTLEQGDYIRAISLLVLLDTHFLTTRSNTYTMYASLFDRENPESSIRTQVTFDRSDLVPRIFNPDPTGMFVPGLATPLPVASTPEIVSERRGGYFATAVDN